MKEAIRRYTGSELLRISPEKSQPIIEDFLFENDYIMIVAPSKMGKSILAQQIACSLTSATPLFNTLDIPNPVLVWYFATEGKDDDTKGRLIRMDRAVPLNTQYLTLWCSRELRFNTKAGENMLEILLNTTPPEDLPKVIIIDALYRAIKGSLKNDDVVNDFHHTVSSFADKCDAAVIVVHHMKKRTRTEGGDYLSQSDEDSYGSAFLTAAADHIYWLNKCNKGEKNDRILKCDTQRSGNIIDMIRLRLMEPDPLYYKTIDLYAEVETKIFNILGKNLEGLDATSLIDKLSVSRGVFYLAVKELVGRNAISKSVTRPVIYKINNDLP